MKHATVQRPMSPSPSPVGAGARHRFALGGAALALAAGLGTPALARTVARAWVLPIELGFVIIGAIVALGFLAVGWVLGRRVDKLADEARRDPMTNIGNRRHWEECLAHEVARAADAKMPLSLLVVDVDHLKRLNDEGGHGAGDEALSIVGEVLRATCRSRDVAARFGGDEFAVLLPRTRASEARAVAERIRARVTERRHAHGEPIKSWLTVSVGVADLASIDAPRAQLLFEAADRALYAAKQRGRDRVEIFERTSRSSTVVYLDDRRRKKRTHRSL